MTDRIDDHQEGVGLSSTENVVETNPPGEEQESLPLEGASPFQLAAHNAIVELSTASLILQGGTLAIGVIGALGLFATRGATSLPFGVTLVVLSSLVGWMGAKALRAMVSLFDAWAVRTREAEVVETRIAEALERVAQTLETRPAVGQVTLDSLSGGGTSPRSAIAAAIRESRWGEAETLIQALLDNPDQQELGNRLQRDYHEARAGENRALRTRIDAAMEVNDPDRVLELHASLVVLSLGEAEQRELDHQVGRWLIGTIQKRLRGGTIGAEVVDLIGRIADRFDHTPEGASLRASLPTLRRCAGLCPRCGLPYSGIEDACPACLGTDLSQAPPPPTPSPLPSAEPELEPDPTPQPDPYFIRDDLDSPEV